MPSARPRAPPRRFYDEEDVEPARAVCRRCPLATACLDYALDNEEYGVWGGTTPAERVALRGGAVVLNAEVRQRAADLRVDLASEATHEEIADKWDVSTRTVERAARQAPHLACGLAMSDPFTPTRQEHPLHINSHLNDTAHPAEHPAAPWTTSTRDEQMAEMALAGETLQAIGLAFGVTRERVRQVLAKRYGITGEDMLALRRAMRAERLAQDGATVMAWVRTNPGRTLEEAAQATGVPVARIRKALSRQERAHRLRADPAQPPAALHGRGHPRRHPRGSPRARRPAVAHPLRRVRRGARHAHGVPHHPALRVLERRVRRGRRRRVHPQPRLHPAVDARADGRCGGRLPGLTRARPGPSPTTTRGREPARHAVLRHRAQPVRLLDRGQDRGDGQRSTSRLTAQPSRAPMKVHAPSTRATPWPAGLTRTRPPWGSHSRQRAAASTATSPSWLDSRSLATGSYEVAHVGEQPQGPRRRCDRPHLLPGPAHRPSRSPCGPAPPAPPASPASRPAAPRSTTWPAPPSPAVPRGRPWP